MSFRVEFSTMTGNAPSSGSKRPVGHGTPAEVAGDLLSFREKAGLDAFQINFHGNRNLDQLLQSMECFMRDVAPRVSGERIGVNQQRTGTPHQHGLLPDSMSQNPPTGGSRSAPTGTPPKR